MPRPPRTDRLTPRRQRLVAAYLARFPCPAASVRAVFPGVWALCEVNRVPPEDVRAAGFLGVCTAAARWRPGRGMRFQQYALMWVRATVECEFRRAPRFRANKAGRVLETGLPPNIIDYRRAADVSDLGDVADRVAALPERWRRVLELRCEGYTLREVADRLGVTRERVRQIASQATARCRE